MKLLDLHTAEYFNDNTWYYGKDTILLKQIKVISACKYVAGTGVDPLLTRYEKPRFNGIEFLEMNKQPHTDPIVNRLAEKVGAVIYGGRYVLTPLLKDAPSNCKVGDVIKYLKHSFVSSIYYEGVRRDELHEKIENNFHNDIFNYSIIGSNELMQCGYLVDTVHNEVEALERGHYLFALYYKNNAAYIGNIFEEYSKKLRNQPNKFEELYYLIYGTK